MLAAAEASMYQTAQDEAEAASMRAKLYAPPSGSAGRARPAGAAGMRMGQAQALMAQMATQDARYGG